MPQLCAYQFKKCTDFDMIIDAWDKKLTTKQTCGNLTKFITDEYAKMKAKLDECTAFAAVSGHQAGNAEEMLNMDDYANATSKILAVVA